MGFIDGIMEFFGMKKAKSEPTLTEIHSQGKQAQSEAPQENAVAQPAAQSPQQTTVETKVEPKTELAPEKKGDV